MSTHTHHQRIYLAGAYRQRQLLKMYAFQLTDLGHEITSRWVFAEDHGEETFERATRPAIGLNNVAHACEVARRDIEDIFMATTVIVFSPPVDAKWRADHRGHDVELGIALAAAILRPQFVGRRGLYVRHLYHVGPRDSVFTAERNVRHFDTWDELTQRSRLFRQTADAGRSR